MAETSPSPSNENPGGLPEKKAIFPGRRKAPPSLLEEGVDTLKWLWECLHTLLTEWAAFSRWCGRNRPAALALAGIVATLVYFYGVVHPFMYGTLSTARWAWQGWNPEGDQSYGMLVPVIALGLFFYHRNALKQAPAGGYGAGLLPLGVGMLLYVLAVRCLNPRMALASIPLLLYGGIRFAWGRAAARIVLFPCVFLIFMVPVGALQQATSNLQFIITGLVGGLSHLAGISILAVGTTLTATDGSFNFEIAEGCSGIRSLMAMVMLTAVFVHLTQDRFWKQAVIFSCSLVFAIIGNIGRIFSIVLLAKFYDPKLAAGLYHEYSGFLFFPIAILAMIFFAQFVNFDFRKWRKTASAGSPSSAS
jgi:exosortase